MAARSPSCSRRRRGAGIDHLVAAPAKPRDYDLAAASERLADECSASSERAVCLARLDPWQDDAPDRLARLLEHPAVRGLLLHPWEETFPANHERALALAVQAAAHGRPVIVEAGHPLVAEALSLADLARRVEGTVVMTRGGQVNMAGLAQQSADLALDAAPNLCALSAGMYRQDWLEGVRAPVRGRRGCSTARARRSSTSATKRSACAVRAMADDERAAVMGGNAAALFGLATEG